MQRLAEIQAPEAECEHSSLPMPRRAHTCGSWLRSQSRGVAQICNALQACRQLQQARHTGMQTWSCSQRDSPAACKGSDLLPCGCWSCQLAAFSADPSCRRHSAAHAAPGKEACRVALDQCAYFALPLMLCTVCSLTSPTSCVGPLLCQCAQKACKTMHCLQLHHAQRLFVKHLLCS